MRKYSEPATAAKANHLEKLVILGFSVAMMAYMAYTTFVTLAPVAKAILRALA